MSRPQRKNRKPQPERAPAPTPDYRVRRRLVLGMLGLAQVALLWRAVDQQVLEGDFLRREGQLRHLRLGTAHLQFGVIPFDLVADLGQTLRAEQLDRNGDVIKVTVSMGIAVRTVNESLDALCARAAERLAQAADGAAGQIVA